MTDWRIRAAAYSLVAIAIALIVTSIALTVIAILLFQLLQYAPEALDLGREMVDVLGRVVVGLEGSR
ncbi:hypothetical protein [Halalkalicoccus jeotgali]|uniref:Uncharacterized protein n=1 Tax=Halalkalicoccus jeotgali (strain DSM 18796 / CECT 7217 / JCM 14584 / KCTC 4019 / B3) TaxID=795797 RepID=D8J9L5_HALJB|nr:hypothetical protein [Halalkalicoccus jeotgali]ADJ14427.1 hypothetical protein HacjB3_05180 [Halalkalicoccus jeotgali B3]ELY40143.1 hypothetical protein C497_03565 [Halalkalicoccus jeotgali B3]